MINRILVIASIILICTNIRAQVSNKIGTQPPLKLWYLKPASAFEEALVLGNGKAGATVYGGVESELIHLNDITLWSGEPVDPYMNRNANQYLPLVRDALKREDYPAADTLIRKMQGKVTESYAPLGDLLIDFTYKEKISNYYRELDIDRAIASVSYHEGDNVIKREYLVSHPDNVFVIHISATKKQSLNFTVKFNSKLPFKSIADLSFVKFQGQAPIRVIPSYVKTNGNRVIYDHNKGTRFTTAISAKALDGTILHTDSSMVVNEASDVTIYVSIATSFNGFDKNPVTNGLNDLSNATSQLQKSIYKNWRELISNHLTDYQRFIQRVSLNLSNTNTIDIPTDERLQRYSAGAQDPYLETLYFQFGRYLLISSSRTMGVPANLQGLWNPHLQPPWSGNYTMNINAEENYWLAENTQLSEMHLPFLSFLSNLEKTGRITAKTYYDAPGWVCHHTTDIWAMTNPVGNFGNGSPNWANWNMGGTWASAHLWEHYLYTQDKKFLSEKGYPLMRGAAEFCLAMLIQDVHGNYITSPASSPENHYTTEKGYTGSILYGGTADLAMIRELFLDVIAAQKVLGIDKPFRLKLEDALFKMHPYQVGKNGNLQEWYFDWKDPEPKHRHQSHLYGLFPGTHISLEKTPFLANAARKTLEIKGDETTGWSKGWRINLWARLKDGNHAYKMYRELLKYAEPDNGKVNYSKGGGTYPNLLDAHPPFQIDGNFGGSAAVAEMLLQSSIDSLELLPALPDAWKSGSIKGLKARGGFIVSITWEEGQLQSFQVKGIAKKSFVWKYHEKVQKAKLNENGFYAWTSKKY